MFRLQKQHEGNLILIVKLKFSSLRCKMDNFHTILTDLVEGDNVTALNILINWFSHKVIFNQVINRDQVIHNGKHYCQFLDTISNRYKFGCGIKKTFSSEQTVQKYNTKPETKSISNKGNEVRYDLKQSSQTDSSYEERIS